MIKKILSTLFCLSIANYANADITVSINSINPETGKTPVGSVTISETKYGLLFTPNLHNLEPGQHGFHIHQNPSCEEKGMAAGGHFDPSHTNKHFGPYTNEGHLGDLPFIMISKEGILTQPILAPRLKSLSEIKGHSLMLHEGGDNYSDSPSPLGGGGARMYCGIIP